MSQIHTHPFRKASNAGVMLLMAVLAAPMAQAQEPPAKKSDFFRQLGGSLKDAGQRIVGLKPGTASRSTGPIYTPISGSGKIAGLYKGDNHQQAQLGKLDWPRTALTFTEWGTSLSCWTVEARIWTSPTVSTTEVFQACADAPLTETDDLGDTAELNTAALWKGRDTLTGVRVLPSRPNTGAQRTSGPNPPAQPFQINASRAGIADRAVDVALRVAWVSGFLQTADFHPGPSGLLTPFKDTRMWLAGFKPEGNQDRN